MSQPIKKSLNIIFAAGGTGGHMIPAEATADALKSRGHHVTLVTDPRGHAYPDIMADYPRFVLKTSSMGGSLLGKIKGMVSLARETIACRRYLRKSKTDIVMGFGGYPSMPVLTAARSLGIPFILHEQNTVLGRANRLMAPYAKALALAYDQTKKVPDGVEYFITGNPVREDFLQQTVNIDPTINRHEIIILGGSQGARILSDEVAQALAALDKSVRQTLKITHQARKEDVERVRQIYEQASISANVESYFIDIPQKLAKASLLISRAGASTLAEATTMGIPMILVPLKIAMDDHQRYNADVIEQAGGGVKINEDNFSAENLSKNILDILSDTEKRLSMAKASKSCGRPNSAHYVADMLEQVSKR